MRNLFILLFTLSTFTGWTAERVVTGTVKAGDSNELLVGVRVTVDQGELKKLGITNPIAVFTDSKGAFSVKMPEEVKSISFSYLGYKTQTVSINSQAAYQVVLEIESTQLKDVVVTTGYQEVEKRKLTASVSVIDISDETVGSIHAIDQAVLGKIAGVSSLPTSGGPGAPMKIRIRGTSSINGTQDPLWVLDGLPLEGNDIPKMEELKEIDEIYSTSIAGINPADIESITVLKDAAATAIYGARAANGVIVVTTKNGRRGKPKISFSSRFSFAPKSDISRLNLLNSNEKLDLELELYRDKYSYLQSFHPGAVAKIANKYSGLTDGALGEINALRQINTDWNDLLFRSTFNQEYNISLSGGSENATYYTSIGYYDETGNIVKVGTNRFNITGKTVYRFTPKIKLGVSLFANRRKTTNYLSDYSGFTNMVHYSREANPYQQLLDGNGNYIYDDIQQGNYFYNTKFNILEERNNTSNDNITQAIVTLFDFDIRFTDALKLTTQLGLQSELVSIEKIADGETYTSRNDKVRGQSGGKTYIPEGGFIKKNENKSTQVSGKAMLEYRKTFNQDHEVEFMIGSEIRRTGYQTLFTAGYGFDRKTLTTKPVIFPTDDAASIFPLFMVTNYPNAYVSGFSTYSYTLLKRYTIGGSIRFDGSNLYGVQSKYRYQPLYSIGGLWRISDEGFMQGADWISNLSMKASFGVQGNIDKNTSHFIKGKYRTGNILPGYYEQEVDVTSPPNPNLRWEKTKTFNAGIDFSLFKDAITVEASYYRRNSSDLIGLKNLPLESGFPILSVNWAEMYNQGVELSIATRNIHTRNFTWFTSFNVGYDQNKVTRFDTPKTDYVPRIVAGYPLASNFTLKTAGVDDQGYPLFLNKEGEKVTAEELFKLSMVGASVALNLSDEERHALFDYNGTSIPPVSGGISNTFRYKAFELGINCIFNLGHKIKVNPSYLLTRVNRSSNTNRDVLNRWTSTNTNTNLPALIPNGDNRKAEYTFYSENVYETYFDYLVRRGDYMRVQNIRVAYNLPEKLLKLVTISAASVALECRNPFVIGADYRNYLDPETMGNTYAQPIPRSFILTLSLNL